MRGSKSVWWIVIFVLVTGVLAGGLYVYDKRKGYRSHVKPGERQQLQAVQTAKSLKSSYDVIVVGTDPEGIAAAISAARNGLSTLLIDGKERTVLGGLATLGMLNSIDMTTKGPNHDILNKGLFLEWFKQLEGDSFDVVTAANAFNRMVQKEEKIDLILEAKSIKPLMEGSRVTGITVVKKDGAEQQVKARSVIDATQDADIAAAAGVPFTFGREDIGDPNSKMAVTLVFGLKNVTPEVWKDIRKRLNDDKDPGTGANEMSAWGYGELHREYISKNPDRVRMRGLNIGRQNDETALINALLIFGVDPLNPESIRKGIEDGKKELPHVIEHLRQKYPEFANIELGVTAPELYVRESRHILGEYRLTMIDILENRDHWDRIGFGSYPVDIQRTSPNDWGAVASSPDQFAIPFRTIVPQKVDGLLVVGRSASFDTLPHGSARVIPTGMAAGEAAGAAAKLVQTKGAEGITFRALSKDKDAIKELQAMLSKQGMDIQPYTPKTYPFMEHKTYEGVKTAATMALAYASYNNDFGLDKPSNALAFLNNVNGFNRYMAGVLKHKLPGAGTLQEITDKLPEKGKGQPLTLELAASMIAKAVFTEKSSDSDLDRLVKGGFLRQQSIDKITNKSSLTTGEAYLLIHDAAIKLGFQPKG